MQIFISNREVLINTEKSTKEHSMATNKKKAFSSPEDRKASRIGESVKVSNAEFKVRFYESDILEILFRQAVSGNEWCYDFDTRELVEGGKLPLDIREKAIRLLAAKAMPAPKEVIIEESNANHDLFMKLVSDEDQRVKVEGYKQQQALLDAELDVGVDTNITIEGDLTINVDDRDGLNLFGG